MSLLKTSILAVLCALASLPIGTFAHASCNALAPADSVNKQYPPYRALGVSNPGTNPDGAEAVRRFVAKYPYKGALGRARSPYVFPGDPISVVADNICAFDGGVQPSSTAVSSKSTVIGAVLTAAGPTGARTTSRVYADKATCQRLFSANDRSKTPCVGFERFRTDKRGIVHATMSTAEDGAGRMRVLLLSVPDAQLSSGGVGTTLSTILQPFDFTRLGSCSALCQREDISPLVCIDDFYTLVTDKDGKDDAVPDDVACELNMPDGFGNCDDTDGFNSYRRLCHDTEPTSQGYRRCGSNETSQLRFWRSNCGGMHIPFDYEWIRRQKPQGNGHPYKQVRRVLSGPGAISRHEPNDPAIYLPGREFIGATACLPEDDDPTTLQSLRLPEIEVLPSNVDAKRFGLRGSVDKDVQILHVFPRMPVRIVCDYTDGRPQEACLSVKEGDDGGYPACYCNDKNCSDYTCVRIRTPSYFACTKNVAGYPYEDMPCTNPSHCPDGGSCSKEPSIVDQDTVWISGSPAGTTHGRCRTAVTNDDHQCGYSLFDVSTRLDSAGVGWLFETIGQTTGRKGTCERDPRTICLDEARCTQDNLGRCVGYRGEAHGKK